MSIQRFRLDRRNKLPPNTKSVARPHKFGNPFRVQDHGRDKAIELYRKWLAEDPEGQRIAELAKKELRGCNLACFCKLDEPCHADVLIDLANKKTA